MDYIISPSVMCMDLMNLGEQIKTLNKHVSMYHVDFIDGVYLKNFSITLPFIAAMRKITDAALDIHVMLTDPFYYLDDMIEAGSTYLSFHSEMLMNEAFRTAHYLHKHGRKLGVVLVPGAPIEMIYPYISHLDKITVMMVDPGFSGGIFVPEALDTVRKLKELRKEKGYHYIVEADGQCNEKHFTELKCQKSYYQGTMRILHCRQRIIWSDETRTDIGRSLLPAYKKY